MRLNAHGVQKCKHLIGGPNRPAKQVKFIGALLFKELKKLWDRAEYCNKTSYHQQNGVHGPIISINKHKQSSLWL